LQEYTVDELAAKEHPLYPEVESLQLQQDELWQRDAHGNLLVSAEQRKNMSRDIKNRLAVKRSAMYTDILLDADVVSRRVRRQP
jgi:hypothetical protein